MNFYSVSCVVNHIKCHFSRVVQKEIEVKLFKRTVKLKVKSRGTEDWFVEGWVKLTRCTIYGHLSPAHDVGKHGS